MYVRRGATRKGHDSIVIRWQEDEKHRNSQTVIDGQKTFAFIWTISLRSTSRTVRHGTTGTSTRSPSRWYAVMMIAKVDRCEHEEILSPLHEFSQVFDKNKDERILLFRRTREYGKDHSMKHREQSWNDRVKFGTFIGRNFPLHHPHNNGGNTNTKILNAANIKTLDGEITSGGNSDDYRHFQSHIGFFSQNFACKHQRMTCTRREVKTGHFVARTLLNGSAWSTERAYMRGYKGKCGVCFGLSTEEGGNGGAVQQRGQGRM